MQRAYIITIFFLILALIFTFQNTNSVSLKFIKWNFSQSVALVTIIVFFAGFIGGWIIGWSNRWKKKNEEIRTLKKQVADLSKPTSASNQQMK